MAFVKVSDRNKYYKYAECKAEDVLVTGVYKRTFEGKFGPQHEFLGDDGVTVILNSAGHLDYLLDKKADVGQRVQVVYLGQEVLTSGKFVGKSVHKFELYIDDSQAPVVSADLKKKVDEDKAPWEPANLDAVGV